MKSNVPNILSECRLAAFPVQIILASLGLRSAFLVLFVLSVITDCLDGYLARKMNVCSEHGAKLDSWGDFAMYISVPICGWLLWPDLLFDVFPYIAAVLAAFLFSIVIGFIKFGAFPSYHTYLAKISAVLMSAAVVVMFAVGSTLLFKIATVIPMITAIEYLVITVLLRTFHHDVHTFAAALRLRKADHLRCDKDKGKEKQG